MIGRKAKNAPQHNPHSDECNVRRERFWAAIGDTWEERTHAIVMLLDMMTDKQLDTLDAGCRLTLASQEEDRA